MSDDDDELGTFKYKEEPEDLCCLYCELPYLKPCRNDECGHVMCLECLQKWKERRRENRSKFRCPECRIMKGNWVQFTYINNSILLKQLDNLKVVCLYRGCGKEMPRGEFNDHVKSHKSSGSDKGRVADDEDQSAGTSWRVDTNLYRDNVYVPLSDSESETEKWEFSDSDMADDSDSDDEDDDPVEDIFDESDAAEEEDEQDDDDDDIDDDSAAAAGGAVDPYAQSELDDLFASDAVAARIENRTYRVKNVVSNFDQTVYSDPLRRLAKDAKNIISADDIVELSGSSEETLERKHKADIALKNYCGVFRYRYTQISNKGLKRHNRVLLWKCDGKTTRTSQTLYFGFRTMKECRAFLQVYWLANGRKKPSLTLYALDKRFPTPLPFFKYDFSSMNPNGCAETITTTNGEVVDGETHVYEHHFHYRRALAPQSCVVDAKPLPWSQGVWDAIAEHMVRTKKVFEEEELDELSLPQSAFARDESIASRSDVFFDRVEPNLLSVDSESPKNRAFRTLSHTASYMKYFFYREIKYLTDSWFKSIESVVSLRPRALYVLYHVLHPKGDKDTKIAFFKYLYVRDDVTLGQLYKSRLHDNGAVSKTMNRICKEKHMSVNRLFECSTFRYSWPLALFSAQTYAKVSQKTRYSHYVDRNNPSRKLLEDMMDLKVLLDKNEDEANGDTCVPWEQIEIQKDMMSEESFNNAVSALTQSTNSARKVRVGSGENDYVLVAGWRHQYAEMARDAVKKCVDAFLMTHDERSNMQRRVQMSRLPAEDFDRVYQFPDYHPVTDPSLRLKVGPNDMSSEQLRVVRAMEHLPMAIEEGIPGSGKTRAQLAVAQTYHPDAVICFASQNATLLEVTERKVSKRALTFARFLVLHSQRCTWREDIAAKRRVKDFNRTLKANPFLNCAQLSNVPAKRHLCDGEYYDNIFGSYSRCPIERIKLVIIDEASLMAPEEFCSIISVFTRCCVDPPRFLIGGDRAQLPSIASGDLLGALSKGFPWATIRFNLCFRFPPTSLLARNAEHIRKGEANKIVFHKVTKKKNGATIARDDEDEMYDAAFGSLRKRQRASTQTQFEEVRNTLKDTPGRRPEWHLIHVEEPLYNKPVFFDEEVSAVMKHLLQHDEVFKDVHVFGETSAFQIVCPTNQLCTSVFKVMEQEVFAPRARKSGMHFYLPRDDHNIRLYEGMKFTYGRNVYADPYRLCNNLVMVVLAIEEVQVKYTPSASAKTERLIDESLGGDREDAMAGAAVGGHHYREREAMRFGDSSGSSPWEQTLQEFERFDFKNAQVYKCRQNGFTGTVPTTLCRCSPAPSRATGFTIERRIVAVPASDVDELGHVTDYKNKIYIPWTSNHQPYIRPASAVTIHSSQGTECDCILAFMFYFSSHVTREMFHVAATRAKKTFVCVSNRSTLTKIVNQVSNKRNAYLGEYLRYTTRKDFEGDTPFEMPSETADIRRAKQREDITHKSALEELRKIEEEEDHIELDEIDDCSSSSGSASKSSSSTPAFDMSNVMQLMSRGPRKRLRATAD